MPWHLRVVNEGQETAKIAKSHAREWAGARIRRHKIPSMNICPVRDSCRSTYATSESQELTKRKEPRSCPILCLFIPYLCYIFTFISSYRRMSMVRDCASSRQDTLIWDTARRSDEQHDERWDIPFGRDTVPRVHNNIWIPEHGLCEMRERLLIYWLSDIGIDIQDVFIPEPRSRRWYWVILQVSLLQRGQDCMSDDAVCTQQELKFDSTMEVLWEFVESTRGFSKC